MNKVKNARFLRSPLLCKEERGARTRDCFKINNSQGKSNENNHGERPLITVITVVFNAAETLEQTIRSVVNSKLKNIEYIIIDGGSTDGTVDIIRKYEHLIDYWVSEPDLGIYDAMNKGIGLARGQWIYHLNNGDRLLRLPTVFATSVPNAVMLISGVVQTSEQVRHIPAAGLSLRFHNTLHHQGTFYRLTTALQYDTRYKVFADFDMNQNLLQRGAEILLSPEVIAIHGAGGVSHTTDRFFELYQIVRKNYGPLWVAVSFCYFKLRGLRKRLQLL